MLDNVFDRSFAGITHFFLNSKLNPWKKDTDPHYGGSTNKILEAYLPLGNLVFGDGVQAHCEIAIWKVKANKRADAFFSALQFELEK